MTHQGDAPQTERGREARLQYRLISQMHLVEHLLSAGIDQVLGALAEQVGGEDRGRHRRAHQEIDRPQHGVKWEPTEAERAYNEGRSTQVPINPAVRVRGRFSRQLRYGNTELVLER